MGRKTSFFPRRRPQGGRDAAQGLGGPRVGPDAGGAYGHGEDTGNGAVRHRCRLTYQPKPRHRRRRHRAEPGRRRPRRDPRCPAQRQPLLVRDQTDPAHTEGVRSRSSQACSNHLTGTTWAESRCTRLAMCSGASRPCAVGTQSPHPLIDPAVGFCPPRVARPRSMPSCPRRSPARWCSPRSS